VDEHIRITRRGLLRVGLLGSVVVWAGGQLGCATRRAPSSFTGGEKRRVALTPTGEEILRAVIPVVLGTLLPVEDAAREKALDVGLSTLDDYLAYLPVPLQHEARDVFETLDLLPTRVLLVGTWDRWSAAPPETIEAFLRSARQSRFDLVRRMFAFLQSMAVLAWFDQRAAWPAIGYGGPPIDRPLPSEGLA
jgi:hypothetical protein